MSRNKDKSQNEPQPLGEAIRQLLSSYKLTSKFDEATLINSWERLVGKPIAKRTKKVYIKNKVLFVEFNSSSMKSDFAMHKNRVLDIFKKEFGDQIIAEIIIM